MRCSRPRGTISPTAGSSCSRSALSQAVTLSWRSNGAGLNSPSASCVSASCATPSSASRAACRRCALVRWLPAPAAARWRAGAAASRAGPQCMLGRAAPCCRRQTWGRTGWTPGLGWLAAQAPHLSLPARDQSAHQSLAQPARSRQGMGRGEQEGCWGRELAERIGAGRAVGGLRQEGATAPSRGRGGYGVSGVHTGRLCRRPHRHSVWPAGGCTTGKAGTAGSCGHPQALHPRCC